MKRIFRGFPILILLMSIIMTSCTKTAIDAPINLGNEIDFSSPVLQLGESWQGNMGGLIDVSINYDIATDRVYGTVKNVSGRNLCWGLSEPHMQFNSQTVGELGPEMLGALLTPNQVVTTSLYVLTDPRYTGYNFDGYVIHMEVYDCSGGTPLPY